MILSYLHYITICYGLHSVDSLVQISSPTPNHKYRPTVVIIYMKDSIVHDQVI